MRSVLARKLAPLEERRARAEALRRAAARDAWLGWSMTFGALAPALVLRSPALGVVAALLASGCVRAAWLSR